MRKHLIAIVVLGSFFAVPFAFGGEPGWERGVIKFGAEREKIRGTDILHRPYRPLHVYGNTVRRRYYHGRAVPLPRRNRVAARR